MSIEEIKDINKLKQMLKSAIEENKYLKECCIKAGEELAKNSFEWDGKEKNLVVQAMELNDRYEKLKAENEELKKKLDFQKNMYECARADESDKFEEILELKQALKEIKEIAEECYYKCNPINNCDISCKYYNDCNGEFSYLLAYLNKQISECEVV